MTLNVLFVFFVFCFLQFVFSNDASYKSQDVVKLVDYVNRLHWIDLGSPLHLSEGAKVNIRRRKTELVLPKGQFATYETNIPPKHIILKSECDRSIYVSVFQALNPSNLKESKYVSCESNSWLFNTTDEELKIIKIENRNSVVLTVKRLAAGSSTVEKTIAILHPDGKKRLRQLRSFEESPMVISVLGLRGSGKSTIASLLSGKEEMFESGRRSTRTTTIGIDMSPIIPFSEYLPTLKDQYKDEINFSNHRNIPLIITDSEGMGVRGEDIDLVASVPPLLVSNVIIWITTDSLRVDEELKKLDKYLNLANKIQDESTCEDFKAAHLIVVINKMQGDESDEELTDELVEDELDNEDNFSLARNLIRKNLKECFQSLQVIGFPYLKLPSNATSVKYDYLKGPDGEKFITSLLKIVNLILNTSNVRRTVSGIPIGPDSIEELIKKVIDISNSGSEFTRNDFKSALLIAELKQSLYQFEVNVTNKLSVIERKRDIEDHLAGTTVLFKEIELMRKHIFTSSYASEDLEVEWKAFNQRLLESIRTSLFSTLSRALESIFDDSKKFTNFCANIPSGTHRCIKDNVNSFENTVKLKLKSLPADLASDANIYIDAALKRINNNLNYCRGARSSYSYTTMGKRDKLISIAADIETELREDAQKLNPEELINLVKDYLFLPFVPSVNRIINCKVDGDLAYDQFLLAAAFSAKRFLQISLKRNKFEKDSGKLYAKFDFMNIVSKIELFNRQMRVIDEDCDLPSILSKVPENVEELNILCMNTLVYGHSSTNLRRLRVDTVNLEVNSKGASLKLVEPSAPVKATPQVPGSKGIDAGSVEIHIHSFVTGGVLEVVANGGPGGAGGDGVLGGKGSNGVHGNIQSHFYNKAHYDSIPNSGLIQKNIVEHHCRKRKKWYRRKKSYVCGRTVNYVQHYNHVSVGMTSGGKGASGTSGAPGGAGGKAGSLTVEMNGLNRNHFKLSGKGGAGGAGGLGGGGGKGGIGGNRKSLAVTYTRVWDWHENSGERMTSSGVSTSERISGKENDGPKGENGPNGPQGPLGDFANRIEFRNISEERTLFVMLSKLKTEIEPTYMSNGNGLKSIGFAQDLLGLFQNQKEVVSNVSLLYKEQNHSSIIMNLIQEESKLLTKIVTLFETERKSLQLLENNFKELSANQQNDLVLTSKDVEMARVAIEEISNNFYVRERDIATNPKTVTENLDKAISTIISIVTVVEAFNEKNVDLSEIYHAAKKFTERTGHNSGIFTLDSNIRIEYPELKNCSSLFYNISVLNMFFKNKVKDDKKIENISGNVPKCTLKNFFSDGYRLRNYIHYFKITDLNRRPKSSVQNIETYSEYYQLRSFLHTTLGTIMANRSSHILHSMSSHVQVRNKVELVIRDSNYIEELVKSLREKVQVFKSIKQHPAMNQSDVVEFLDNIVEKCIFALTDIGKELRRKIQSIGLQLIPYFPDSRALEKLADLTPWSSTSNFSSSLLTLQELINKKLIVTQKLSIYLDSFDFPVEFSFLRSGNNATFPILGSTINQLFVSTVEAKALNKDLTPIPSISVSAYREEGDYLNLGSFSSNSHTSNDFRKLTSAKTLSSSEMLSSVYILDSYYTIVISNDSKRETDLISGIQLQFTAWRYIH